MFPETRGLDNQTVLAYDFSYKSDDKLFNKADGNSVVVPEGDIPMIASDASATGGGFYASFSSTVVGYKNYPIFLLENNEKISQRYWYAANFDSGIVLNNKFFKIM